MKIRALTLSAFLMLIAACAAFSQGPSVAPTGTAKVAIINSDMFLADKAGITKLVNVYKALDIEFKPKQDELVKINNQFQQITKYLRELQDKLDAPPANPAVDANAIRAQINTKNAEGERLQLDFKQKQDEAKTPYEKKEKQMSESIYKELSDALETYGKKNGIDLILDVTKFAGGVFVLNNAVDITGAFIKDFNAKSSGVPAK